jgi:glycosyltransferase involved in cell wall biosynthesis
MKISVIMPVFLGYYEFKIHRSASNPEEKFIRAVNSFLNQTLKDSELMITADGCEKAEAIWLKHFYNEERIGFQKIPKQVLYSGEIRQAGIRRASGEIICYLDHDDMFGRDHLQIISNNFDTEKYDWVYYNDYFVLNADHSMIKTRYVVPERNIMGTSAIAHKRNVPVIWGDNNTHDFDMIEKYLLGRPNIKIPTPQYYVCHCSGLKIDY